RVGADAAGGFLIANSSNSFKNAATGIDVELLAASNVAATVTVVRENLQAEATLANFVAAYNTVVDAAKELTRFDPATGERGPLQGQSSVQRIVSRLDNLVNRRLFGADHAVRSLNDLGVRMGSGG